MLHQLQIRNRYSLLSQQSAHTKKGFFGKQEIKELCPERLSDLPKIIQMKQRKN